MKKQLLLLVMMLLPMVANADAVEIDGIYYNLNSEEKTAEVTQVTNRLGGYSGDVLIPQVVSYNNEAYTVIAIGERAFEECNELKSIYIPSTIIKIDSYAFLRCI